MRDIQAATTAALEGVEALYHPQGGETTDGIVIFKPICFLPKLCNLGFQDTIEILYEKNSKQEEIKPVILYHRGHKNDGRKTKTQKTYKCSLKTCR